MPRDAAPTRSRILAAALQTLRRDGLDGFSIAAVAQHARVAKGLVIYHFGSRQRLLAKCGSALSQDRERRLAIAWSGGGLAAADGCWSELRRQQSDGTARAWQALCSAGVIDRTVNAGDFEKTARGMLLDGCATALGTRIPTREVQDAFYAAWLALLALADSPPA